MLDLRDPIQNCPIATLDTIEFLKVCPRVWANLEPTEEAGVRHCPGCDQRVYACVTPREVEEHAEQGHCVVQLYTTQPIMGQPLWLLAPEEVSAEEREHEMKVKREAWRAQKKRKRGRAARAKGDKAPE